MAVYDPTKHRLVRVHLSALTRLTWSGLVAVPKDSKVDLRDLVDAVYDQVDGGDYQNDPHFWERGNACYAEPADPMFTSTPVALVAVEGPLGLVAEPANTPES